MTISKKSIKRSVIALFLFTLSYLLFNAYSIWTFGEHSAQRAPLYADAAVVLGAAVWDGKPSPVFQARIDYGIKLYKKGYVRKIIFTGGKGHGGKWAEAEVARDYAIKQGVSSAHILVETQSKITEENLLFTRKLAKASGLSTFAIVSDPLHMKRSMTMAKKLDMDAYAAPTPNSAYKSMKTKLPFLLRELFYYTGYVVLSPVRPVH
ncbi:YdcF family protein [Paenibacillus sp. NEAU-GSW1]|nr:YdcF family protein [Paenibacillus sp. NEAU-GSW1]MUT66240.1 YdcF family protein [Paenibacillus sp. NEAU-GSW1]